MNIENELKLIPAKGITKDQIIRILQEKGITPSEEGKIIHQEDTYFDDKEGSLEKVGGSFRIRRKGDKTQVTYKIPIKSDTQYKQRREYEIVVPKEYEQNIDMNLAIKLLKEQYPELTFPENMQEILTVINDRDKTNLICPDGTVLEMAFDSLKGRDGNGNLYYIHPEIEFETITGNPENLVDVYDSILKTFPDQTKQNVLSKYARTKKEIDEGKLTLEEVAAAVMLNEILRSDEFNKLQEKGQMLHRYDRPTISNLHNFEDFDYLLDRISKIKTGEYKIAIPQKIANKKEVGEFLRNITYEVKEEIDLEDMFCLLLSDIPYQVSDMVLADFLDKEYFEHDRATTNRLLHSQQVMLGTGLICKSSQVGATLGEQLTAMVSALSHDIGHIPYSHINEEKLQEKIGSFSHDNNGADVIEKIYKDKSEQMISNTKKFFREKYDTNLEEDEVEEGIKNTKSLIQRAIREHSRTNSERRGEGIIVQGPREADKIHYVMSDIRDLQQFFRDKEMGSVEFFSEEFLQEAVMKICEKKQYEYDVVKKKIEDLFVEPIREGKFGKAVVNVINTVKNSKYDGKEYYDVDQDIWRFIEYTIARTKDIRRESGIDDTRPTIKKFSGYIATRKFVKEYLGEYKGDRRKAREQGLNDITNMGEIDGLEYAREDMLGLSKEEIELLKNGDYTQITDQQLLAIRRKTYELLSRVFAQTGHGTTEELAELEEEVNNYGVEELIETYLNAPVITRIDEEKLDEFKVEDVQLKINPGGEVTVTSILRAIGGYNAQYSNYSFDDYYYRNNVPKKTLGLRIFHEENRTQLRVKEKLEKKVSEIIRNTYEVEGTKQEPLTELVEKLNGKYPGLDVEIVGSDPYRIVSIQRILWTFEGENGEKIELREDIGKAVDVATKKLKPIHQIEIHGDSKNIGKIKKHLIRMYGREIFTKDTKAGGEQQTKDSPDSNGEGR